MPIFTNLNKSYVKDPKSANNDVQVSKKQKTTVERIDLEEGIRLFQENQSGSQLPTSVSQSASAGSEATEQVSGSTSALLQEARGLLIPDPIQKVMADRFAKCETGVESSVFIGVAHAEVIKYFEEPLIDIIKTYANPKVLEIGSASGQTLKSIFFLELPIICVGISAFNFDNPAYLKDLNEDLYSKWLDRNRDIKNKLNDGQSSLEYLIGDAHNLINVVKERTFDVIFSNKTWIHFAHPIQALEEALSSLNCGGKLLVDSCFLDTQIDQTTLCFLFETIEGFGFTVEKEICPHGSHYFEGIGRLEGYLVKEMVITRNDEASNPRLVDLFNCKTEKTKLNESIIVYNKI